LGSEAVDAHPVALNLRFASDAALCNRSEGSGWFSPAPPSRW